MATELNPLMSLPDTSATQGQNWLDVQGLESLKVEAGAGGTEALTKVAQQFESLFLGMMLKSMRDAKLGDGVFDNDSTKFYQDLYDEQLSVSLSQGKGLGIASMLVKSLSARVGHPETQDQHVGPLRPLPPRRDVGATPLAGPGGPLAAGLASGAARADAPAAGGGSPTQLAQSPEEFVALVMPHAVSAAASLGVSPLVLVAQAALETRWGQQVPATGEGSSFNLFGIKADPNWTGRRVARDTLEYQGGVAVRRREPFRAYESLAHGFDDFVAFLKGNLRYAAALGTGSDTARFADALQKAGYATDPGYSTKIEAILGSDTLRRALSVFKNVLPMPIP